MANTPLGLGYIHFTPAAPEDLSIPDRWESSIKSGLESIAAVDNVRIHLDAFAARYGRPTAQEGSSSADFDYRMHPKRGYISFVVNIPPRDQEGLHGRESSPIAADGRFAVETHYGNHGPATIVRFNGDGKHASSSVVIVREFLRREMARAGSSIKMETVGPSPIHLDVGIEVVDPAGPEDSVAEIQRTSLPGYDKISIRCTEQALGGITAGILYELQFFYECARAQELNRQLSWELEEDLQLLVQLYQTGGVRSFFRRIFSSGRMARDLLLSAIMVKLRFKDSRNEYEEKYQQLKDMGRVRVLEPEIAKEIACDFADRIDVCENVAQLLEGGRKKEFEVLVLSSSTLFGAIAGAVAALISKA
jgi:hypothetical protein